LFKFPELPFTAIGPETLGRMLEFFGDKETDGLTGLLCWPKAVDLGDTEVTNANFCKSTPVVIPEDESCAFVGAKRGVFFGVKALAYAPGIETMS
jgi:hypothetical protein